MVTPAGADFSPGDIVGNTYEVIGYIGRGAMGYVYHVRHVGLPKEYALKTLSTDQITETAWLRFQIEAQSIAKMFHPNIITIHNFAVHKAPDRPEQPFYVMDLLAGRSLMEELRDNDPLPLPRALSVFAQAASGIGYAHSKGIIHRDIKPGNVMLLDRPDAGGATVKIVDFGIAKLTADSEIAQQHLTSAGEVFGSPFYMSPEQGLGQVVDARSDVYSLGVTFFEALTGDLPFKANSAVDIMLMHQSAPIPQLNAVVEGTTDEAITFPPTVQIVVERMLAKDPNRRYQNMQELVADLTAIHFSNPLPSLSSGIVHGQDLGLGRRAMLSQAEDSDSQFDGEESLQSEVWVSGGSESDSDDELNEDSQYDLEWTIDPSAKRSEDDTSASESAAEDVPSADVRALTTITTQQSRPKAQVIFLTIAVAAVVTSGLAFLAIKNAGKQARLGSSSLNPNSDPNYKASQKLLGPGVTNPGENASPGTKSGAQAKQPVTHHHHHEKSKLDPEEDKEPGPSVKSDKPFGVMREVKNGWLVDFDFPTDVLIGKIRSYNWTTNKEKTQPAKGKLHYGPTDWLCFSPSRIVGKYPQYLKRFRRGEIAAVELKEYSNSDAILEACTAIPGINELIIHHARNLTNKSVASLNKFVDLEKFDGSHGAIDGITLARATCWGKIREFRCSHCRNITPMLLKLKGSKDLRYLDVHESNLTYQDYKAISELSGLQHLKFETDPMTLNELKLLANLPKLETIELFDCDLEEASIPILRQFKALKKLKMGTPKTLAKLREKFRSDLKGVEVE
ncbi:MAG: serine/threonine-protein kinase [Candidatus Obscuribacterales bacterium]|jgi:serine/threonine protein kinase